MTLGPHIIQVTPAGLEWARHASIVKQLDGTQALRAAPERAIRVFRHYFPEQRFDDPAGAAAAILAALGGYRHPRLLIELYNECAQRLGEGLPGHLTWTYDVTARLHEAGLRVGGFSFSTGQPDRESWRYLRDQGYAEVDALAIHEYWGQAGFSQYHALRHRQVHEWLDGEHPPMVITECGRDAIEGGKGGWRRDGLTADQYIAELLAYQTELAKDSYICGAVVFTAGPTPDWEAFSTDGLEDAILASPDSPDGGSELATLQEQYPKEYAAWLAAGGVEHHFRAHLLGIGALVPAKADVPILAGNVEAAAKQLTAVVAKLPFA